MGHGEATVVKAQLEAPGWTMLSGNNKQQVYKALFYAKPGVHHVPAGQLHMIWLPER